MKVRATCIDAILDATLSSDQQHCAIRLRDADATEFTLGIPVAQLARLVESSARMLAESARNGCDIESKLTGTKGRFPVLWWNISPGAEETVVLVLTLESGGSLAFVLPRETAVRLGDALCAQGVQVGFGPHPT